MDERCSDDAEHDADGSDFEQEHRIGLERSDRGEGGVLHAQGANDEIADQ